MKRIFTKIIGLVCLLMISFAHVQGQQDTVYIFQKDHVLYKRAVNDIDSITFYYNGMQPPVLVVYTVSYNGNGHTSGTVPSSISVESGEFLRLPSQGSLVKTGYNFVGWNSKSDGTGSTYVAGASITPDNNITLYAKWQQKSTSNTTIRVNGISFDMVYVEGGNFTMGCTSEQGADCDDIEKPSHMVILSDYYIGEFEVTQGLWKAVMDSNPSPFKGDKFPVVKVSWEDCMDFIRELNRLTGKTFALPTEAQWEYAARGGNKSQGYKYAGSNILDDVAWYDQNNGSKMHEVGAKQANELGLYDMSGNAWEWCSDWLRDYTSSSQTNPSGPTSGSRRMFRGGNCYYPAQICRVSNRDYNTPALRSNFLGFRLSLVQ